MYVAAGSLVLCAAFFHAAYQGAARNAELETQAALVRDLELTDLCLFTEARYARHPSQADLHSAFQDHPLSMEHFPAGSLIQPQRMMFVPGAP